MFKIIIHPNKILRKKSRPIKNFSNPKLAEFIPKFTKTMLKKDGIGLAAPQVGLNLRIIAVSHQDGVLEMINPKILKKSLWKQWGEEGCLSIPEVFGEVKRRRKILIQYQTPQGKIRKLKAKGLLARVIQHEIDHLEGILFIDKAQNITRL